MFRRFIRPARYVLPLTNDPSSATGFATIDTLYATMDNGVFFEVQLKGLATLGQRLNSLLEDTIQGYRSREDQIGH